MNRKLKYNLKMIVPVLLLRMPIVLILVPFIRIGEMCRVFYDFIDDKIPGLER